jgi:CubicO group peptidase (beta-lactamase class C family)
MAMRPRIYYNAEQKAEMWDRWQGKQIVPKEWVRNSTSVQVLGEDNYFPYAYGYQWWRLQDEEPTVGMLATNDVFFALGFGGQFIFVVPHLNMVVVSTAANFGPDEVLFLKLLRDHISPAVLNWLLPSDCFWCSRPPTENISAAAVCRK